MLHVVPQEATTDGGQPEPKVFKRSSDCFLLVKAQNLCESCNSLLKTICMSHWTKKLVKTFQKLWLKT